LLARTVVGYQQRHYEETYGSSARLPNHGTTFLGWPDDQEALQAWQSLEVPATTSTGLLGQMGELSSLYTSPPYLQALLYILQVAKDVHVCPSNWPTCNNLTLYP
jgi:hypothetical protein